MDSTGQYGGKHSSPLRRRDFRQHVSNNQELSADAMTPPSQQ